MNLWSTVSLVDHLQPARTLPTHALCALYLHTPHERPWLVTPAAATGERYVRGHSQMMSAERGREGGTQILMQ